MFKNETAIETLTKEVNDNVKVPRRGAGDRPPVGELEGRSEKGKFV